MRYKEFYILNNETYIHDLENDVQIPRDPANTDYQEYLQWLAEGNEPLPADEPEGQTE